MLPQWALPSLGVRCVMIDRRPFWYFTALFFIYPSSAKLCCWPLLPGVLGWSCGIFGPSSSSLLGLYVCYSSSRRAAPAAPLVLFLSSFARFVYFVFLCLCAPDTLLINVDRFLFGVASIWRAAFGRLTPYGFDHCLLPCSRRLLFVICCCFSFFRLLLRFLLPPHNWGGPDFISHYVGLCIYEPVCALGASIFLCPSQ